MALKSTSDRYGQVAIAIHWISALLVVGALISGCRAADMTDAVAKASLLRFHAVAGITVLVLTLARLGWWWLADRKPDPAAGQKPFLTRAASIMHGLFYVLLLGMVASGIGMMVLSGAGAILFGGTGGVLPDFWNYPPRLPHGIGARALVALVILHSGAALYHQFVLRDRALARMGFGR